MWVRGGKHTPEQVLKLAQQAEKANSTYCTDCIALISVHLPGSLVLAAVIREATKSVDGDGSL